MRRVPSGIFRQAIKNGKADLNPVRETAHRKENNVRVRYLSADEEAKLVVAIRARWPQREAEILVALHSGMRRSEQYSTAQVADGGLKWEHINFRAGIIRLPRSKSGRPREIPMNSVLRETLRSIIARIDSPYVFDGTDPAKWFREVLEDAGIKNFHWHDLRHTFAEVVQAPEVARALDSIGRETSRAALRKIMARAQASGLLTGRPAELAEQLAGLLWRDLMVSLLLGVAKRPNPHEVVRRARDAAATFLQLHPLPNHAPAASHPQ